MDENSLSGSGFQYETPDLHLAGFLLLQDGVAFAGLKKQKGGKGRKIFVLNCGTRIGELVASYMNRTAQVTPLAYRDKLNDLRNMLGSRHTLSQGGSETRKDEQ